MIALVFSVAFAQEEPDPAPPRDTGSGVADTAGDCMGVTLTGSSPDAGATNVPVDVQPSLTFDGGCGVMTFDIALTNAATGAVLASMPWTLPTSLPATVTLQPSSPLPYDTDLLLTATDNYYGLYASVPFHTAAADLPPLTGTLVVDVLDASFVAGAVNDDLTATVQITPIADASGLSHVELTGPNGDASYDPAALGGPLVLQWSGVAPEQVCFEAVQVDGRGGQIGPARDCVTLDLPVDTGCGCDGTQAPIGLGAVGVLLLARRRKERRRA